MAGCVMFDKLRRAGVELFADEVGHAARVTAGAWDPPPARGRCPIATELSQGDHSCIPIRAMVWPNGARHQMMLSAHPCS